MNPPSRMHKRFWYRLAREVGSTKVMFAGKTKSQKNKAEALSKVLIHTDSML
jgi:hypothetical protein